MKKLVVRSIAASVLVSVFSMAALAQETPVGSPGYQMASPNAGPASASSSPNQEPRWGSVYFHALNIGSMGFTPLGDGVWEHGSNGWSWRTGGTNAGTCTNVNLPSGALLQYITAGTYDVNATNNVAYELYSADLATNAWENPVFAFATAGTPGAERLLRTVSPAVTINNNRRTYSLCIFQGGIGTNTQHAGATFWYLLQVSPAPASASFTDVPTGHWAFQWIEALRSSGITSGCTASTYCPDANVTRAEMAVFLSRALGLAWKP